MQSDNYYQAPTYERYSKDVDLDIRTTKEAYVHHFLMFNIL